MPKVRRPVDADPHGSLARYGRGKCRCELCKQAQRDYHQRWKERKGIVTTRERKLYTDDQIHSAVMMSLKVGATVAATRLGIPVNTVVDWVGRLRFVAREQRIEQLNTSERLLAIRLLEAEQAAEQAAEERRRYRKSPNPNGYAVKRAGQYEMLTTGHQPRDAGWSLRRSMRYLVEWSDPTADQALARLEPAS